MRKEFDSEISPKIIRMLQMETEKEAIKTGQEISSIDKSPEQAREKIKAKAEELKQTMEEMHFELTGKRGELDVNGLYRDMLRKMMLNAGLIGKEDFETLKEEYKERGVIEPLFKIAKEDKNKKLKNIPEEATEFEDTAIFFIKHYCEKEHIVLKIFFEQLAGFISDKAIEKKRREIGGPEWQKDLREYESKGQKSESQYSKITHAKMKADRLNSFTIRKKQFEEGVDLKKTGGRKSIREEFKEFIGDPRVSRDLRDVEEKYRKLYVDAESFGTLQTPEGTIRQAEILGLHY